MAIAITFHTSERHRAAKISSWTAKVWSHGDSHALEMMFGEDEICIFVKPSEVERAQAAVDALNALFGNPPAERELRRSA